MPHTQGPFGIPMTDEQAFKLETILKALPREDAFSFRRLAAPSGLSQFQVEERTDVSWITVEAPDLAGDLVLAGGMDDSHFALNPIVTLNHRYDQPPVGRSLWRRALTSATRTGIQAKTFYPPRPASWTGIDWPPDMAFDLVRAGLLLGKSIGFVPLQVRAPTAEELSGAPQLQKVRTVIERWLLLEYSCCFLPMQPQAVVSEIAANQRGLTAQLLRLLESAKFQKNLQKCLRLTLSSCNPPW